MQNISIHFGKTKHDFLSYYNLKHIILMISGSLVPDGTSASVRHSSVRHFIGLQFQLFYAGSSCFIGLELLAVLFSESMRQRVIGYDILVII